MTYQKAADGSPCNSNDSLGYDLETGEPLEVVPCTTTSTSTTSTTASTTSSTSTSTTSSTTSTTTTEEETTSTSTEVPTTTTTTSTTSTMTDAPTTTTGSVSQETGEETAATTTVAASTEAATTTEAAITTTTFTTTSSNNNNSEGNQDNQKEIDEEQLDSFYTCSINENDVLAPPEGAIPLDLVYDYEVYVSTHYLVESSGSTEELDSVLRTMENRIAKDLADKVGLLDCQGGQRRRLGYVASSGAEWGTSEKVGIVAHRGLERRRKRRHLRNDRRMQETDGEVANNDVIAIDAEPQDRTLEGQYECETQFKLDTPSTCTPMRGYMTAWLQPNAEPTSNESYLLSLIETGMQTDAYYVTDSNIISKLAYIGIRDAKDGNVGEANNGNGSGNNGNGSTELESNQPPFLAIGFSVFFTAMALAALLALYVVRKKRRAGSDQDDNDEHALQQQQQRQLQQQQMAVPVMMDPDDIHLLPATEKFDMRSVHSRDDSSTNTEDYEEEDDYHGVGGSGSGSGDYLEDVDVGGSSKVTAGSSLAAMGVASSKVVSSLGSSVGERNGDGNWHDNKNTIPF